MGLSASQVSVYCSSALLLWASDSPIHHGGNAWQGKPVRLILARKHRETDRKGLSQSSFQGHSPNDLPFCHYGPPRILTLPSSVPGKAFNPWVIPATGRPHEGRSCCNGRHKALGNTAWETLPGLGVHGEEMFEL